jgi:hypothetical protein
VGYAIISAYNKRKVKNMSDFTNWKSYPFTVDGVEFLSLLNPEGTMYQQVQTMPAQVFTMMNQSAIRELIGKVSLMSKPEIQAELDRVNEGYGQAYLALA